MLSPRLTNCKGCADIPDLLRKIDCKLAELGNDLYNNVVFMLNRPIQVTKISQLLVYKRVLMFRYCDTHYATRCPEISTEDIASKVIRLTAGCVSLCNEPTVCEITTCAIKPVPNPTTTTTSTSSSTTTSTTTSTPTTTTTTTVNCNFTGVIECSITTTTTTTPPPTTTTTTSYFPDPFGVPCIWSTDGGNPGSVAVYDFDTNTSTTVLVPNDFNVTVGIERPICATEDKLWLVSVVDPGSNPTNDGDDKVYIREWNIDATGASPILTYVREITVPTGQYSGHNLGGTSVWAMTAIDNDTLILGTGNEYAPAPQEGTGGTGSIYLLEFSIAGSGNITIASNDISSQWSASAGLNKSKVSNITYTNSGQIVLGYRLDLTPGGVGQQNIIGNYLVVFPVTPSSPDFSINNQVIPRILLQSEGFPEFSASYNGSKDAPFWGINGLAQVSHPETLEVYTLDQAPSYNLSLTTSIISSNDWLSSATHCSNITFVSGDPNPNCGLTYFPNLFGAGGSGSDNYLGPQTFTYFGMTCTASISNNLNAWFPASTSAGFLGCSGLTRPSSEGEVVLSIVQGSDFSITIDFPVPMNNIPIRAAVLNSNLAGTFGDVYYVETNGGTPTLSINQGCYAQVDGNKLWGGVQNPNLPNESPYVNDGDGEFKVTALTNYTSMTIYGNAPTGGPLFLGCLPLSCENMFLINQAGTSCSNPESAGLCVSPPDVPIDQTSYTKMFNWNKITDVCTEIETPLNSGFNSGDGSIGNNIIALSCNVNTGGSGAAFFKECFIKYTYDDVNEFPTNLQWDGIQYLLPTVWQDYNQNAFVPNIEVIDDSTIGIIVRKRIDTPTYFESKFLVCTFPSTGTELIVEEKFTLQNNNGAGDLVVTYKTGGTIPNKVLVLGGVDVFVNDSGYFDSTLAVQQYDYTTGALEVTTRSTDFGDTITAGAYLAIVGGELYAGANLACKISFTAPYGWTLLDTDDRSCPAGGAGTLPGCRINDGFIPDPNVTTTTTTTDPNTTTTTTTITPGVRTIFTKFNSLNTQV